MKYFLVSNMRFLGHLPEQNKIKRFEYKNNQFWSIALDNIDMFVVNTYNFDAFVLYLKTEELDFVPQFSNLKHVVVDAPFSTKILRKLHTDTDLYTKVYFKKSFDTSI